MGRGRMDSIGKYGFIERHQLWSPEQRNIASEIISRIARDHLEVIRLSFADQHGVLRGKSIVADGLSQAFRAGCTITTTLLAKDTSHRTVFPVWTRGGGFGMDEMTGGTDMVMVPDPSTFRVLPWLSGTGWILCDLYFQDGRPVPFSTRAICRETLARLTEQGYDYRTGIEIEFHVLRLEEAKLSPEDATQPGAPPRTSLIAQGYQYLTENRLDEMDPILEILRRQIVALDLPLRSLEAEFGPSQCELTFHPESGIATADTAALLRSAIKQICRRHGYHATFMCKPHLPNLFASGWHLHQSLVERASGENAFTPADDRDLLSPTGRQFVAGVLTHARAACAFTTPTINGYKRYRPFTLAPDRILWGRDNRGSMIRVLSSAGDVNARIENRAGEPAANPYLYLASQIVAGCEGIANEGEPPPPSDTPYDTEAESLPGSLIESVAALRGDAAFRDGLGSAFIDYYLTIKEAEIARFLSDVTDWEQREYFSLF